MEQTAVVYFLPYKESLKGVHNITHKGMLHITSFVILNFFN